jgi:DNA-binding LacI/PurR family transcriptional regulator
VVLTNVKTNVKPLQARGFKVVLVQGGATPDCICVHCDDHEAGRLAAVHALANGHKELGTIFPSGMDSHPRMSGFLKGVKDAEPTARRSSAGRSRWTRPRRSRS